MNDADDAPTQSDQALYLIDELASLLERTDLATWPERQTRAFRKRMAEIIARVGTGS